jgi:hypothetical protein
MDNSMTASDFEFHSDAPIAASGTWRFTPERARSPEWQVAPMIRSAGMALFLAVSPFTCASDPWLADRRNRVSISANPVLLVARRRITLREAVLLATKILVQAEQGRLRSAEIEADRTFDMENSL